MATSSPGPIFDGTPGLTEWLAGEGCAVAFTTYQAHRLFFLGLGEGGRLRAHQRAVPGCQGLWSDGRTLWVGGEAHLWRFDDTLPPGARTASGADRLYVPQAGLPTGALDIHDIAVGAAVGADGGVVFVNTRFSCLASPDPRGGFRPLWRPPFISDLRAEDRCHLNGLAMGADGRPAFVTAVGRSDVMEGWREYRADGGVLIDVASGEVACAGLSMPHSPRLHRGRLWLLNSGTGEFGTVDPAAGRFEPLCFCPGFARGLAFHGRWAVIGLSRPRAGNRTFDGLRLGARLADKGASPRCGFVVVDTETGTLAHGLTAHHTIDELYDVAVLPGARRPEAVGLTAPPA
ncbi:TIGR03032 family protein [Azospirillum sp.]|uniref:TIGR03032 family protein n=1 Tax=Azospirillum sp. TaxID=34012 RepID=UPI002D294499|nr:TIGR03032 family protein [Azospirillum sp.]HYD71394.1 TIGR03032 family protein [Azospirillum sp.]